MFHEAAFFVTLVILEVVYSLPVEEKIDPVELFHLCLDPEKGENELSKSPVLLLHPLFGTHKSFSGLDQVIAERTRRRVWSVDLRNHGDSPWNNRTDIAALTEDIGHFLDVQNIKKVNLIGHSLGGKIAIHYTLNNPDRVDSLVVEDMRPNNVRKSSLTLMKFGGRYIKRQLESQPPGMNEKEAKEFLNQAAKNMSKQLESYDKLPNNISNYLELRLINGKWQLKHNLDLLSENTVSFEELWTKSAGLYRGPTLFIYGTESIFKVGEDEEIQMLFPNAKLVPFEGAGHLIHENYQDFSDIVINFLNEIN